MNDKHIEQLSAKCGDLYSDCNEAFTEIEAGYGDRDVLARLIIEHHTAECALATAIGHSIRIFDQERRH